MGDGGGAGLVSIDSYDFELERRPEEAPRRVSNLLSTRHFRFASTGECSRSGTAVVNAAASSGGSRRGETIRPFRASWVGPLEVRAARSNRCGVFPRDGVENPRGSEVSPARVAEAVSGASSENGGFAKQCADHTQVRDDGQPSTRVCVDEFAHGRVRALQHLSQVLAASGPHVEIPVVEAPQDSAGRALDLPARQTRPIADIEFAQPRVQQRPKSPRFREDRGSFRCTAEITRNDDVDLLGDEFTHEGVCLRDAAIGERRISVSLPAIRRVPARLGVPNQQQCRLAHDSSAAGDQRWMSPASGSANTSPAIIGV
jgi:hypothetical protein